MICTRCKGEFDKEYLEICPYCIESIENKRSDNWRENQFEKECNFTESNNEENIVLNKTINLNDISHEGNYIIGKPSSNRNNYKEDDISNKKHNFKTTREGRSLDKITIESLDELSTRALNALMSQGVSTIDDLHKFLEKNNIEDVKNVGEKTATEIHEVANKYREQVYYNNKVDQYNNNKIGEDYMFHDMDISNEELSIDAFKMVDLAPSTIKTLKQLNINKFKLMKTISDSNFKLRLSERNYLKLEEMAEILKEPSKTILNNFLENQKDKREFQIYSRRSDGETLQEIADNPPEGYGKVTRERIRQIEHKYFNTIYPIIYHIAKMLMGNKYYLLASDISEIYSNNGFDRIFIYTCKRMKELEYYEFADVFVIKDGKLSEKQLITIIEEYIGTGINLYDNLEELENILHSYGYEFIDQGRIINFVNKYDYRMYGDFIFKEKPSYGLLCANVVREFFPDGIKLNQNDDVPEEDLIKLRSIVLKKYGPLSLPESDRALSARISDYLVLFDRGKAIHPEQIRIDESTLGDIKKYIDSSENIKMYYAEIYSEFEGILMLTSNISNYNFLHGVIQYYYPDEYDYSRDYLIKKKGRTTETELSISERINRFILKKNRPIHKKELEEEFAGLSDSVLSMAISNHERLIQWEYNYYSSIDLIIFNDEDIINLKEILDEALEANKGYSSDLYYYKRVKRRNSQFLIKNKIKSEMNLFYIISNLLKEDYDFRRPHISLKGKHKFLSMKEIALDMLGNPESICYNYFMQLADKLEWSAVTSGMVFKEIEQNYCRVSKDKYILKENFIIAQDALDIIYKIIFEQFNYDILPLCGVENFEDFPDIGYEWNEFLLGTVIREFFQDLILIEPIIKDRRYQKAIATHKNSGLNSYSEIVANVMIANDIESLSESKMLSFLLMNNLTRNTIPKELMSAEHIKFRGGKFYVLV